MAPLLKHNYTKSRVIANESTRVCVWHSHDKTCPPRIGNIGLSDRDCSIVLGPVGEATTAIIMTCWFNCRMARSWELANAETVLLEFKKPGLTRLAGSVLA